MINKEQINSAGILIIDNDLVNVLAIKNILHTHNFNNITHVKPASSHQLISQQRNPNLIVLNLDNTNGESLGVLKNIIQDTGSKQIPILAISRDVNSEKTKQALQHGVKDVLAWPFTEVEVVTRVTNLLENSLLSALLIETDKQTASISNPHLRVIELSRQVEQQKKSDEQHRSMVGHDALTGLANAATLRDHLNNVIRNVEQDDRIVAVLLFSLENFSDITKAVGHDRGDDILRMATDRISDSVDRLAAGNNEQDFFTARYSGGKFALVLNELESETSAISIGHRILAAMSSPFELPGIVLDVGTQVGVSLAPRFTDQASELLRQSEVALHTAKMVSQPLIVYEEEIDNYDPRRLALMADLRKAINNDDLYLVYQPKINLKTGEISGVEALLRWKHPELGLIPPNEFIPMAEQSSVIKPLTVWVLNNAMRQAAAFAKSGLNISIAVNISASSLRDDSLVGYTKMLLQKNNVDPDKLTMEITESAMMQDPNMALSLLQQLSDLGVQISIDDYGTGYSSLAYLKRMPVNEMKIDRTFIKDMATDEDDRLIVDTTIAMGHNFGLNVVAEGVEDRETISLLKDMGVDKVQGFYYAMPMPIDELYNWMTVDNKVAWSL